MIKKKKTQQKTGMNCDSKGETNQGWPSQSKSIRKPIRLDPKENSHYLEIMPLLYFVLQN